VDNREEAEELVTRAEQQPLSVVMRKLSHDRLDLKAGDLALDLGCGADRAVVAIAERGVRSVAPSLTLKGREGLNSWAT